MKRSTKAGIVSIALLVSTFLPPYADWRAPINFTCAVLACVLGTLAALSGRRWWFFIPGSIVAGFSLAIYLSVSAF
ncbi:MAG: hypothetical protein JST28_15315 [Acidobacteria bacterium]|nr:hypothetical protein [Acidobacteriota bacterium]